MARSGALKRPGSATSPRTARASTRTEKQSGRSKQGDIASPVRAGRRLCLGMLRLDAHGAHSKLRRVGDDIEDTVISEARPRREVPEPDTADTVIRLPDDARPHRHGGTASVSADEIVPRAVEAEPEPVASGPSFYAFRLGLGSERVLLDAPALIGRRPTLPRVSSGERSPRLVRVESPRKEVSSTHLEMRQVGGSVVVTDLRSTNGSVVMLPGSVPRTLRQSESMVVSPGTLIDIGDGNVLQVLALQRRDQPAGRQL